MEDYFPASSRATQEDISISTGTLVRTPGARMQISPPLSLLCSDSGWASRIQGPSLGSGYGATRRPQPGWSSRTEPSAGLVNAAALGSWRGRGEWSGGRVTGRVSVSPFNLALPPAESFRRGAPPSRRDPIPVPTHPLAERYSPTHGLPVPSTPGTGLTLGVQGGWGEH